MEALKELDHRAGSVRHFKYRGRFPDDDAFEAFVDGIPLLENVLIYFFNKREDITDLEERVEALVETFSKCPNLKDFEIRGSPDESPLRLSCCQSMRSYAAPKGTCSVVASSKSKIRVRRTSV